MGTHLDSGQNFFSFWFSSFARASQPAIFTLFFALFRLLPHPVAFYIRCTGTKFECFITLTLSSFPLSCRFVLTIAIDDLSCLWHGSVDSVLHNLDEVNVLAALTYTQTHEMSGHHLFRYADHVQASHFRPPPPSNPPS